MIFSFLSPLMVFKSKIAILLFVGISGHSMVTSLTLPGLLLLIIMLINNSIFKSYIITQPQIPYSSKLLSENLCSQFPSITLLSSLFPREGHTISGDLSKCITLKLMKPEFLTTFDSTQNTFLYRKRTHRLSSQLWRKTEIMNVSFY